MASHCRSCGAEVRWLRHHLNGKLAPIDAEPAEGGNVKVLADDRYKIVGPAALGEHHYSHYATCPQASEWRGKRRKS